MAAIAWIEPGWSQELFGSPRGGKQPSTWAFFCCYSRPSAVESWIGSGAGHKLVSIWDVSIAGGSFTSYTRKQAPIFFFFWESEKQSASVCWFTLHSSNAYKLQQCAKSKLGARNPKLLSQLGGRNQVLKSSLAASQEVLSQEQSQVPNLFAGCGCHKQHLTTTPNTKPCEVPWVVKHMEN